LFGWFLSWCQGVRLKKLWLDQTQFLGFAHGSAAVVDAKFAVDVFVVGAHGVEGDA
jgi:hypothetical protein